MVNKTYGRVKFLQKQQSRVRRWRGTMAVISDWMIREGFLEEVTAEQQLWGPSQCPHLNSPAYDEITAQPANHTRAGPNRTDFHGRQGPVEKF